MLHPAFPEEEVARFKQRTRVALMQTRANPGFLAQEMFQRVVYGDHPASRLLATIPSLDKTTRDAIVQFHKTHYVPDHAAIAVSGDVSMAEVRALILDKFSGWKKAGTAPAAVTDPAPISGSKIYFVARPNSVQTNLIVGGQAIERTNPDYDALQVMNKVLGGGPTGRLFIHLREKKATPMASARSPRPYRRMGGVDERAQK
jgi:zinc protease